MRARAAGWSNPPASRARPRCDARAAQNRYEIPIWRTGYQRYRDIFRFSSSRPLETRIRLFCGPAAAASEPFGPRPAASSACRHAQRVPRHDTLQASLLFDGPSVRCPFVSPIRRCARPTRRAAIPRLEPIPDVSMSLRAAPAIYREYQSRLSRAARGSPQGVCHAARTRAGQASPSPAKHDGWGNRRKCFRNASVFDASSPCR